MHSYKMSFKRLVLILCCIIYAAIICVALPLLVYELNRHYDARVEAWFVGGIFVLATLPFSMYGIVQHALNYSKPYLQKYIIRILFMVPIYAMNSWIVLKFPKTSIYLDTIREGYEAFVIYNFMMYLIHYLKYDVENFDEIQRSYKDVYWMMCFPNCTDGVSLLNKCKFGVLQFVVVRTVTSFIAYVSQIFDVYNEGEIDFKFTWSYVALANNFSQMIAIFCLVLFYSVFKKELKPLHPIRQFMCIKAVVFATFWQSVLLAILVKFQIISPKEWPYFPTLTDTVNGLQDFLICIEMFLASIAHMLAFPATPYKQEARSNWAIISNIANAANIADLRQEVSSHYGQFHSQVKRAFKKSLTATSSYNDMTGGSSSERSNLIVAAGKAADDTDDTDSFCEEDDIGPRLMRIRSLSCEPLANETRTIIQ